MATVKINGIVLGTANTVRYNMIWGKVEIRILFREKPLVLLEIGESGCLIKEMVIECMEETLNFYSVVIQTINETICFGQLKYKVYLIALNYKRGGYKNELFDITVKSSVICYNFNKCCNFVSLYHVYKELRKTANLEKELALDVIKNDIFVFTCCKCFENNNRIIKGL